MKHKHTYFFALLLLHLFAITVRADGVDEYIKAEMQKQRIPGISVAVVKDGKVIKAEGYGLANVELKIPAKTDTVYKIGSVSKQFIASGIMLLAEDQKIGLDDRISKYLAGTPDTWKDITIRHLLTHTSGIVREAPGFNAFKVQPDADVIKTAYDLPLRFAPGEKWEYCNVGYFSLAEIIYKVSGKPWAEFLADRIFKPLEMNATRTTSATEIIPNRADSYEWQENRLQNAGELLALRPSGAFISTVLDLAKWEAALYTNKILKASSFEQMRARTKLNDGTTHPYGFGWELAEMNGHKIVHHGGTLSGFRAQFARFVDDGLTVIVLTNGATANPNAIARGIAAHYITGLSSSATK
jgi:CubicO group peptidase (beta-lactamase class C family)